jgi:archaeosine-15-forming tRNA-guanine transglycosylase
MVENGGIIKPGSFPFPIGGPGPELLYIPKDAKVLPHVANVTVKVNAEMTDAGKQIIRETVVEVLKEAMADAGVIVFESKDALATFVRCEVNKLIDERFLHG